MDVLLLSIAVGALAVQSFVHTLVQNRLRKQLSELETGVIKTAQLLGQLAEVQGILVKRVVEGKK